MRCCWMIAGACAAALLTGEALAQGEKPREEAGTSQTLRSFVLMNKSDQAIAHAQAVTTKKKKVDLTAKGEIRPEHSSEFMIQLSECVDTVNVTFKDGKTVNKDGMNDCREPTLNVFNDKIEPLSMAGGPLHRAVDPARH